MGQGGKHAAGLQWQAKVQARTGGKRMEGGRQARKHVCTHAWEQGGKQGASSQGGKESRREKGKGGETRREANKQANDEAGV